MPGTKEGAQRAKATMLEKYGSDYFQKMGSTGGKNGTGHKFAHGKVDPSEAGKIGGAVKHHGK